MAEALAVTLAIICLVSLYFYLTRPLDLKNIMNKNNIKEINISTDTFKTDYKLPNELRLNNEKDINEVLNILGKYKYSRVMKVYNPRAVPANPTNGVIHIFMTYSNTDNKLVQQYFFVDSENDVAIRNKNRINIDYKISGNDEKLFENLSSWLSLK